MSTTNTVTGRLLLLLLVHIEYDLLVRRGSGAGDGAYQGDPPTQPRTGGIASALKPGGPGAAAAEPG